MAAFAEMVRAFGLAEALPALEAKLRPSIRLLPREGAPGGAGASRLGGLPDLPEALTWPRWNGAPMSFIGQLRLADFAAYETEAPLPREGLLSFFFDSRQAAWGYTPEHRGGWLVHFHAGGASDLRVAPYPEDLPKRARFAPAAVSPWLEQTLPDLDSGAAAGLPFADADEDTLDRYYELCEALAGAAEPIHRVLGYADQIQNDGQLECELVTSGIDCGQGRALADSGRVERERAVASWLLLLQVDSDRRTGMEWGDGGRLYFWIRRRDLHAQHFGDVWCIFQCY
jgi:uncharacterized protein YwqG